MAAYTSPQYTIAQIIPGFGTPSWPAFQILNTALAPSATITIPASGTLTFNGAAAIITKGWIRVRIVNISSTQTYTVLVTGTDGTTTTTLYLTTTSAAQTSTSAIDLIIPFLTEVQCNKFTITLTGSGGTGNADVEVDGVS